MPVIRPSPRHARLLLVAILALGGIGGANGACSLNPQPIPPGYDPDAAFGGAPENGGDPDNKGDMSGDASFADVGGGGLHDSGSSSDAPVTVPGADAGAAGDAGDASDASADAADDG